jgi:ATP-binding cassette subfamily F protein 3
MGFMEKGFNAAYTLDEPTNHLDIESREVVEGALDEFEGSLLTVSHDRYFLDREVNQIWEISGGEVHIFKGNYSEYLAEKERGGKGATATVFVAGEQNKANQERERVEAADQKKDSDSAVDKQKRIEDREAAKRELKNRQRKVSELKKRMDQIQKEIEKLETEKKSIEDEFLNPELVKQPERMKELSSKQKETADSLDARYFKWQELEDRLKAIQSMEEA